MDRKRLPVIEAVIERIRDFPDAAFNDLFAALDAIERTHDLLKPLPEATLARIKEALAEAEADPDGGIPHEVVMAKYADELNDYDPDAAGKEAFTDVVQRIQMLSGEDQGAIADLLFTVLNVPQFDIPPPEDHR